MSRQPYWEDIEVDSEVAPLPKVATTLMLVKWAGASGDYNPLHYDSAFADSQGVGRPIVHGALKRQWLVQLMTDWIGRRGVLRKISYQNRARAFLGDTITCKGRVTKTYMQDGERHVECDIWAERQTGEVCSPGKATVILPAKG